MRFFLSLFFAVLVLVPGVLFAQGGVNVRAETQLRLKAKKTADGTFVIIELRDNLEQILEGQTVSLRLESLSNPKDVYEDSAPIFRGKAEFALGELAGVRRLSIASYSAKATFAGNEQYAPSSNQLQIDISKDTPGLEIESPAEVSLTDKEAVLLARLTLWGKPVEGVEVRLEGLRNQAHKAALTDEAGEATFLFVPQELPSEGPNPITLRFAGDELRNPAEAQRLISLVVPVEVTLSGPSEVSADDDLELTGSLQTPRGPLAKKSVTFVAQISQGEERPLGGTVTDEEGRFGVALAAKIFKTGKRVSIVARFTPDAPWLRPAESRALALLVRPPQPVPAAFYLVPLFICGAIVFGMFLLRSTSRRSIKPQAEAKPKTGLLMTQRASLGPEESGVSGFVRDAKTQALLPEAEVVVRYDDGSEQSAMTDEQGHFSLDALLRGRPSLRVEARGYVAEEFRVELPHRGKYRGVTVALLPVREMVLDIFREVAVQVLPEAGLWGTWTPREIRRYAREKKYHVRGPIGELVLLFEGVYFAGLIGDAETIAQATKLANEAKAALAPPAVVAPK